MTGKRRIICVIALMLVCGGAARAQTTQAEQAKETKWPQWALDVRRFDIITFGLYPFAYLVTGIGYDVVRMSQHDWSGDYAPWPVKGSAAWTSDDYKIVILASAALSLTVAAVDLVITLAKRHKTQKSEEARIRAGIDIRRVPLYETQPAEAPPPTNE